jgi:hypothetical protein
MCIAIFKVLPVKAAKTRPETICFKNDPALIAQLAMPMRFSSASFICASIALLSTEERILNRGTWHIYRQAIFIRSDLGEQRDMIFDGRSRLGNVLGIFLLL